jgi:hypothetical protein
MTPVPDRSLNAWVNAVRAAWGAHAATQLATALSTAGITSAASIDPERLGGALGERGCALDEIHDWLALVPEGRAGRQLRQRLHQPEALIRFTAGWADTATARPDQQPMSVDLLRLRLHAHVRRAAAQGVGPTVALVVARPSRPSPDTIAHLVDAASAVFAAGEPIARGANGNVVILARRDDTLDHCLEHLARIIAIDPELHSAEVHLWVEPVGESVALLDALLIDLSA